MNDTTLIELSRPAPRASTLGAFARRAVLSRLATLREGLLRVREDGETREFGIADSGVQATLEVLDPACYAEIA